MSNNQFITITLGGGCFWCIEAVFEQLQGVEQVVSGYAGGEIEYPTYQQVCSGNSGHAEVIQVTFDPEQLSLQQLLSLFFDSHDPTQLNQQGNDIGTQYRSIILAHSEQQLAVAKQMIMALTNQQLWSQPIVTEVILLKQFYPAEQGHQQYFQQHPNQPYCQAVIAPKVQKLLQNYPNLLKITNNN